MIAIVIPADNIASSVAGFELPALRAVIFETNEPDTRSLVDLIRNLNILENCRLENVARSKADKRLERKRREFLDPNYWRRIYSIDCESENRKFGSTIYKFRQFSPGSGWAIGRVGRICNGTCDNGCTCVRTNNPQRPCECMC